MKLTANQIEAMDIIFNDRVGETVLVITGQYDWKIAPEALKKSAGYANHQTLRGLQAKGFIEVEPTWKGANVTVLKAYNE